MARSTILVIDDEPNILTTVRRALEIEGFHVEVAGNAALGLAKLAEADIDLILLDVMMPGESGLEVLPKIRVASPETVVVMMSGNATIETAVLATKAGAHDFVEKPLSGDKLLLTVNNALSFARLRHENSRLRGRVQIDFAMIGKGVGMRAIFDKVAKTAPTTGRVLITGENGTGKELVARAIHEHSKRSDGPFVKLNCAAIPSELIESELFGHEKGAFTGATQQRRGKFELADGGTLFLDEIGDMNPNAQAKVLRVLQENELERVGGAETIKVDVRVVAATNKDLQAEIAAARFREDLFYRLAVVPIELPPLRARREDIPTLVGHFTEQLCSDNGRRLKKVAPSAMTLLMQHEWPGNVRELKNVIERLVILTGDAEVITEADVGDALPRVKAVKTEFTRGTPFKDLVNAAEREIIMAALDANDHHVSNTARELQLERSHLYKKMRALGIDHRADDEVAG
ncbi:MAG: sigma-54-dependent Fis family transcriptional regulator [Deltaproteobacteria bacterium]|nr:sigma-54-dependent Fis family transcriptional regulator [Deltaproteobacteria bacterium]